jgi:lycopene beta-cyclase
MSGRKADVAIVGGGLAGGLIALALHKQCPDLKLALIEQGSALGGNHRWSWFDSDLDASGTDLLQSFQCTEWNAGYTVCFPDLKRDLSSDYRSLASADFHQGLIALLASGCVHLNAQATQVDAASVTLSNGEIIEARAVIDCRPFAPSPNLEGGWQIFLGQHIKLDQPHGIDQPTIMDASVEQIAPYGNGGAYRFVYVLPLAPDELFIEDTYYADQPKLDRGQLSGRIKAYQAAHGWSGQVIAEETGVLPVITGGNFAAYLNDVRVEGVAVAGARGGFSHPLTSYTVPIAVENALAIASAISANPEMSGRQLAALCEKRARKHWRKTRFYRILGRMLFGAAEPSRRVDIFQRFYRLPEGLIERFYSVHSTGMDKFRILCGKPPVSIPRAIGALATSGAPLTSETPQ